MTPHVTHTDRTEPDNQPVVHPTLEDGVRPPPDPECWDAIYNVVTSKPCPECGTAIVVILGPTETLREFAPAAMADYPVSFPEEWHVGYDDPVYIYCDNPLCSWHGVAVWRRLRPRFEAWITGDAPTWRERLEVTDELE